MAQPRRPDGPEDEPKPERESAAGGDVARPSPTNGEAGSVKEELAATRERLAGVSRERDSLAEQVSGIQQRLDAATTTLAEAQRDLGRLEEVTAQRDAVVAERDSLGQQLRELQTATDERIQSAVRSALDRTEADFKGTISTLQGERDALQARVEELQGQVRDTGTTSRVTPTVLANRFAEMLERVGADRPADRPVVAALTSLDIEAKGILEAPKEGEDEPVLRTVEAGDVHPEQLSTVRMRFRLLPPAVPPSVE